jgi:hypothetical protein
MKPAILKLAGLGLAAAFGAGGAFAQTPAPTTAATPDYVAIHMETTVDKSAKDTWAKVGAFCDLGTWLKIDCKITSGTGDVGTVRGIAGNRVIEVMTAKSEFGYGYTQPAVMGKWYNLYHGFLEAVQDPKNKNKSKLVYTLMLDESDKADQAAKDKDVANRRKQFEGALANMKAIAEGKPLPGAAAPAKPK